MSLHAAGRPAVVGVEETLASELVTNEAQQPRPPLHLSGFGSAATQHRALTGLERIILRNAIHI